MTIDSSMEAIAQIDDLLQRLFPICRSLTGNGVRETFRILQESVPVAMHEIPSGTTCYDWTVPNEWNIRDAYVADQSGNRLIDFRKSNIHLVGYSIPVNKRMHFRDLRPHLHTLPNLPEAIPYRTSYYSPDWGFCLRHCDLDLFDPDAEYDVLVDATLEPGSLSYAEGLIEGTSSREYIISSYCCHPSLANDNLSGLILWAMLYQELAGRENYHSYRFVAVPETIGAIAYLARNEHAAKNLAGGLVITTVGGPGPLSYKRSFRGDHEIDEIVRLTLADLAPSYLEYPFDLSGSDERQFSSPAFRVPTVTISKDKYQEYDYYHTSLDDLEFVKAEYIHQTLRAYLETIDRLELNRIYVSRNPAGEPMLGKRNLYPKIGGQLKQPADNIEKAAEKRQYDTKQGARIQQSLLDAILWMMFYSDGTASVLDISKATGLPMRLLDKAARQLTEKGLLEPKFDLTRN